MIELRHGPEPEILKQFREQYGQALTSDTWNHFLDFAYQRRDGHSVSRTLYGLQEGLCVYCERKISCDNRNDMTDKLPHHVDHVLCRANYKELVVEFSNLALSCSSEGKKCMQTCGAKKGNRKLPILPTDDHAAFFDLDNTNGNVIPAEGISKEEVVRVKNTVNTLNLNLPALCAARKHLLDLIKSIQEDASISEEEKCEKMHLCAEALTKNGEAFSPSMRRYLASLL